MALTIEKKLAKKLIASYRELNTEPCGVGLKTPDGQFLNGFFIDRDSLDIILANPDVVGVSVHLAKHPSFPTGNERVLTIVFGGAEPNPDYKEGGNAAKYLNKLDVWDQVEPCPPVCSTIP
jgi:hypothetical protein